MSKEAFAPAKEKVVVEEEGRVIRRGDTVNYDGIEWKVVDFDPHTSEANLKARISKDEETTIKYEPGVGIRFTDLLKDNKEDVYLKISQKDLYAQNPEFDEPQWLAEENDLDPDDSIQAPEPKPENYNDRPLEERFKHGDQVVVDGKPYTVESYDGYTGDVIMKDSGGDLWTESQENLYAQNPVMGEKYYDTDHGPVSETELQASYQANKAEKKEVSEKQVEKYREAAARIKEIKKNIARLGEEGQNKLRQTAGVINKMQVERDYEGQQKGLKKDIRKNRKIQAKSFLARLFNFLR